MAYTSNVSNVRVGRKSYLRRCDLFEVQEGTTIFQFWAKFDSFKIAEQDGDAEHYVTSSDRIDSLAKKYYGDSRLWWIIAEANDLEDPVSALYMGRVLRIPSPKLVLEKIVR